MDTRAPLPMSGGLEKLDDRALLKLVLDPVQARVSFYEDPESFLKGWRAVGEAQGLVWAAWWCQTEVCNGGFHQFLQNPTGMLAPEAAKGFDLIGVKAAAGLVREAMGRLRPPFPRDTDARSGEVWEKSGEGGGRREEWDPFFDLDDRFYEVTGTDAFVAQAARFIRSKPELFFMP